MVEGLGVSPPWLVRVKLAEPDQAVEGIAKQLTFVAGDPKTD
ncbi:hypothetical protein ACFY8B_04085 [Streptomyces sp. NPDC012751]